MQDLKPVVFRLNNEEYGVDIKDVNGIESAQEATRIPNSLSCIKGVINLRGKIIPIYDIRKRFELGPMKNAEAAKLIIVRSKGIDIALEVDSVDEINNIPGDCIFPLPSIALSPHTEYIKYIANMNGKLIVLLNLDELLTDSEIEEAGKIIEE